MTRKLLRLTCAGLMLAGAGFASAAAAQTTATDADVRAPAQVAAGPRQTRTAADEDFDLNIVERHITEANYEASVSVAVGEESTRGLNVRVGAAVGATQIDVLLRNVQGHVRFRATLEQILRRLNERRPGGASTTDAPPVVTPSP